MFKILAVCLTVVAGAGYGSFPPATEMDQKRLQKVVSTVLMDRLFERVYDQFVVYVSGPENYRELETADHPMNGRIPMNVYQDIRGSKERYFSRWDRLPREELRDKEFIFTADGTAGGSRALVLAAYWKERYEQLTGACTAPHQIKVITFNADSFGDDNFQRTINRVIERESILNFYVKSWSGYMFPRRVSYVTSVPVSMVALCQENYPEIFRHLSVIGFCGCVAKVAHSSSVYLPLEYALIASLPIALLRSAYGCHQYLSHLLPSPGVAHKSLENFARDAKKKNSV